MTRHASPTTRLREVRLFVSYSHLDREWFGKLLPLLKFKTPTALAYVWHDSELKAGDRWDDEIRRELERMDVFLCLLSYDFLASDYITDVEKKAAFEREKRHRTIILPLLLCDMDERDIAEFKPFNPLPVAGRSWRSFELSGGHTMDAHKPIRKGLLDVLEKAQSLPRR